MTQQLAEVLPDQFVQLPGRDEPGRAVLARPLAHLAPLAGAKERGWPSSLSTRVVEGWLNVV